MTTWRMSFRRGNQGHEMWPDCLRLGIAAITYDPIAEVDLSQYPEGEPPKELWAQLAPTQKASLRRVAYEMKKGDIIYVKQGPKIVGRGIVQGPYQFARHRLIDPYGSSWLHQVLVEWESDFAEVKILLGAEQLTVKELTQDNLRSLEEEINVTRKSVEQKEALEGEIHKKEVVFRSRNQTLIQAKKANSDYRCEVCGFNFQEVYGSIGHKYIVAHHIKPISTGPSKTTLEDIVLLCANCHAMVHTQNPPISSEDLRKLIERRRSE